MFTTRLRKVGGSVMLSVPPALLDVLKLEAGARVGIAVDGGRLVVEPEIGPRYTLDDLLAQCDPTADPDSGDGEWLEAAPTGDELL
ncbi:antitoxin [uncultured Methylobacterium sp.]|jgi:antitoxin ChpS|uniref:AbrB/MazE/SpoVT family DNA-binding domain-containing protein n=1 Tax=uncultured Methylobacterium sp. TaxID=157278 RepID=UPI00261ADD85|nr:antitoxin [uncultured Methylobacterium sp.]